jgi:hypothetical protein
LTSASAGSSTLAESNAATAGDLAYTDGDAFSLDLKRPVLMNGIGQVADRPDLLDRVALVELGADPTRTAPHRGRVLGRLGSSPPQNSRRAPRWSGVGAPQRPRARAGGLPADGRLRPVGRGRWESPGGWEPGTFTAALESGREDLLEGGADAYPEIGALIELMEKRDGEAWVGTATELLTEQAAIAGDVAGSKDWPKRADTLSTRLSRLFVEFARRSSAVMRREGRLSSPLACARADVYLAAAIPSREAGPSTARPCGCPLRRRQ